MKKLSFKEYYESKQELLTETPSVIFKTKHDIYKYCKVPFTVDGERTYVSFKPKDVVVVEWERIGDIISPLLFEMNSVNYTVAWNPKKMKTWVETSTIQLFD
jgi:hypothetical protein